MRLHTGEKPFVCTECDKAFAFPGLLKTHQRIHQGIKPYQCPVCARQFHEKSALNKHQARKGHEGEPVIDESVIRVSNFRKKQSAGNVTLNKINQKDEEEVSPPSYRKRRQLKEQARES